jgi:hypothetical protein
MILTKLAVRHRILVQRQTVRELGTGERGMNEMKYILTGTAGCPSLII